VAGPANLHPRYAPMDPLDELKARISALQVSLDNQDPDSQLGSHCDELGQAYLSYYAATGDSSHLKGALRACQRDPARVQ
jgi:hypothetical protein